MRRYPNLRQTHLPELMGRVLAESTLPRRDFIRTASGLVLIGSAQLVLPGCPSAETSEVVRVVVMLFEAALKAFSRSEEIHGDVGFDNPTSDSIRFEGLMSLIEPFADNNVADQADPELFEVPPGGKSYGWGNLWATNTGPHLVNLLLGGDTYSTPEFDVG